jgi:hypothetical protein
VVVANINVGVVTGLFSTFPHEIDEGEGGLEILEIEGTRQLTLLDAPAGQSKQMGNDLFCGKTGHRIYSGSDFEVTGGTGVWARSKVE